MRNGSPTTGAVAAAITHIGSSNGCSIFGQRGAAAADPIAVRYAYTQQPNGNILYNKDGQPVGPFSTIGYGPEQPVTSGKK